MDGGNGIDMKKNIFNKNFICKWLIMAGVMLVINILVFCNLSACCGSQYTEKKIDLTRLGDDTSNASLQEDGSLYVNAAGAWVELTDVGCEVRTVTLICEPLQSGIIEGHIMSRDEGHAYRYSDNQIFMISEDYPVTTRRMESQGSCNALKLYFSPSDVGVYIHQVIINRQEGFHFRIGTFLILLAVGSLFLVLKTLGWLDIPMDLTHTKQKLWLLCGIMVPTGLALFISIASIRDGETILYPYGEGSVEDMPMQQMMLFDAFHHGTVRLDLPVDPDYLLMDNVYDESERIEKGFDSEWDTAFYNGSYYTYFGSLPILVLYEICYILTGCLPGINLSMFLVSVMGILGFFAATCRMLRYFRVKPALSAYIVGNWGLMTASFFFIISVNSDQYTLPIIMCMGCLLYGIAFAYDAVQEEHVGKRAFKYVMSGISLVCVVMLRPAVLLLLLAFIMPLFIGVLLDKKLLVREKCRDVASFAIPVAVGAVVVMVYNWLRFDSVFEFGARYQLTVSDIRYNGMTFDLNSFFGAFFHYGFEGPDFKSQFPYLFYALDNSITYGKYVYHEAVMGIFCMPFNLLAFSVLGWNKKSGMDRQQRYTMWAVVMTSLFLIFFDFGMGGLVGRYVGDFAIGFAFLAFWYWMRISGRTEEKRRGMDCVIAVMVGLTLVMGFLLLFSNDPIKCQIRRENPNIYMYFANLIDI